MTITFKPNKFIYPNNINHFEYRNISEEDIKLTKIVSDFIKENKNKKIIFLNSNAYYFRLVNDMKIDYLDLINTGNWGYNGSEKLLKEIKKNKNALFLVNKNEMKDIYQTDKNALKYVLKNGRKIKSIQIYDVYKIKE